MRLTGAGRNRVNTGDGNDIVEAYSRTPVTIDCGPGGDRVNIGFNRNVKTVELRDRHQALQVTESVGPS